MPGQRTPPRLDLIATNCSGPRRLIWIIALTRVCGFTAQGAKWSVGMCGDEGLRWKSQFDEARPEIGSAEPVACLDLRLLPAPEPMARALEAVDALKPGMQLVLLTPVMPVPLLQLLDARGFEADAQLLADRTARVRVLRAPLS